MPLYPPLAFLAAWAVLEGLPVLTGRFARGQLWVFIVAPFAGAILAVAIYQVTHHGGVEITAADAESALPSEQLERDL